jgi:pSer/pThr/pTyr-binding forkhead associated (FHA) protein/anti-anti-sigma regulatory factor
VSEQSRPSIGEAVHAPAVLRLLVSGSDGGEPRIVELSQPFAVVGSAKEADVALQSDDVSFRHAYLQVLDGRLFCLELGSTTGIFWEDERRSSGWLASSQSVRIGSYTLQLLDDGLSPDFDPQETGLRDAKAFPRYTLEFCDDTRSDIVRSIDRRITLIGRHRGCHVRLGSESVSGVHCALVLTADGLWVVDLLGKGGTRLDQKNVRCGLMENGSLLAVGEYVMTVWRRESVPRGAARVPPEPRGLPNFEGPLLQTPTAKPSTEERPWPESAMPDAAGLSPTTGQPPENPEALNSNRVGESVSEAGAPDDGKGDWIGTLFAVERHGGTLIIVPRFSQGSFRDSQLQIEANLLRLKLADPAIRSLVIDLNALNYAGWDAIGVVVALARQMELTCRPAALCRPAPQMKETLTSMGLALIWPQYPSREAALAAVDEHR